MVFGAALVFCSAAEAQSAGGAPAGNDRFSLSARARASYDSNLSGGNQTIANLRQVSPKDVTYTLGTSAAFQLPSSRQTLFITGSADFDRHQKNTNLDADNYLVSAGASSQLGACSGSAVATYSHRQALIQDLTVAVTKNIADQESGTLSISCGRRGFVGGVNGGISKLMNNTTSAAFVDSETKNIAGSFGYQNKQLGNLSVTALYSEVTYQNAPTTVVAAPTGFSQYGGGLNYSRKIGNRLNGSAGVNYTQLQSNGGSAVLGSNSGSLGADVALNYRATPRLNLALAYSLGNQASGAVDATYVRQATFRLSGDYRLNTRVGLQASFAKARSDYRGGQPSLLQIRRSEDFTVSGGASVKIGRKVALTFDVSHSDRKADIAQFNYKSDRASVGITGTF